MGRLSWFMVLDIFSAGAYRTDMWLAATRRSPKQDHGGIVVKISAYLLFHGI